MHRTTTSRAARLLAATLTATVAFGISAPVVNAAPDRGPGVAQVNKGKAAEKQEIRAQRRFDRLVKRTDRALVRAIKETRVSRLAVIGGRDTKSALIDNVRTDRAAVAAATTAAEVKQYRAVKYILVVNVLRQAAQVQKESNALGGNAEVDALVASAVEQAIAVTALSPRSEIRSARADLSAAKEIVEAMVLAAQESDTGDDTGDGTGDGDETVADADPLVA
ncbi:MAG: hypothetical protein Q8Q02_13680 [Nocardioides sp.]|nr:hypothetical protein [Nocardioides sp.]